MLQTHDKLSIKVCAAIGIFFFLSTLSCSADNHKNYIQEATKLFIDKKYDLAINTYDRALRSGAVSFELFYNMGYIYYYEKKDLNKAQYFLERGVVLYPDSYTIHAMLSNLYFDMNKLEQGLEEYKLAFRYGKSKPGVIIYAEKVKEILISRGKPKEEIIDFFRNIIKINPNDYLSLFEVAESELLNKQYSEALEKYLKILELNPRMKMIYKSIASCYYNLGNFELAFEYFSKSEKAGYDVPDRFFQIIEKRYQERE